MAASQAREGVLDVAEAIGGVGGAGVAGGVLGSAAVGGVNTSALGEASEGGGGGGLGMGRTSTRIAWEQAELVKRAFSGGGGVQRDDAYKELEAEKAEDAAACEDEARGERPGKRARPLGPNLSATPSTWGSWAASCPRASR